MTPFKFQNDGEFPIDIKKYDDLKRESNTKDEEVLALKKKLQEFLTKTDDQEEELRKMSKATIFILTN